MAARAGIYGVKQPQYRLRWRFDFFDGRPSRCGIWNNSGARQTDGAWCVNKNNLRRAAIEGETLDGSRIDTLWECDGPDFVNFEWLAASPIGVPFGNCPEYVPPQIILGLAGISRELKDEVYIDGSARRRVRTAEEKRNILAAWRS